MGTRVEFENEQKLFNDWEKWRNWIKGSKEKIKNRYIKAKAYIVQHPKKSMTVVVSVLILGVGITAGHYAWRSYLTTVYYCADSYKAYKILKKEYAGDPEGLKEAFIDMVNKKSTEDPENYYVAKYVWEYEEGEWFFDPRQDSYTRGREDISHKIKYVNEPCKFDKIKLRISCKIGTLEEDMPYYGSFVSTWQTVRVLVDKSFEVTSLIVHPSFSRDIDIDVCYVDGHYSPFQLQDFQATLFLETIQVSDIAY